MSQSATTLEWKGRTGPFTIFLNPGVFSPTHTSRTIAEALDIGPGDTVVDDGRAGGPTGAELPRMMLESIGDTLAPGGRLYLPTGTIQDEKSIIEAARRLFGNNMESVISREFPLPDIVGKSVAAARMMKEGLLNLHKRGSRWLWRLQI